MRVPIQTGFNFCTSQVERSYSEEIPIDKTFPENAANELAAFESYNKHLYRPNTYLHKWWARRSGTTFRHILKQLVDDSGKRNFYEAGGLEGKIILDPMIGGGTTLHEAIRMGANVIGIDIDPIPVLQTKAGCTLSPLRHKKLIFHRFLNALRSKLAPLYTTTCPTCQKDAETQFVLYGLRRKCSCREVLFVDDSLLRRGNKHDVYICQRCRDVFTATKHKCRSRVNRPLMVKGTKRCEKCHTRFTDILSDAFSERYVPLVIVGMCRKHGGFFKSIAHNDLELLAQARVLAQQLNFGDLQDFRVPQGPKSDDLLRRGIATFQELFTPRQLLYLSISLDFLSQLSDEDRLWMSLLISTSLEFNSLLCGYKGSDIRRPGAIRHVFSHHAYSFPYTALENNMVFSGNTSGTLNRLFNDRIIRAGEWALQPIETRIVGDRRVKVPIIGEIDGGKSVSNWKALTAGERKVLIRQGDASALNIPENTVDYVVTDPPYYDSVQYSDLSHFFRVWLRLFLPREADWHYNPLASAVSEGTVSGGGKYGEVLAGIWKMCRRALKKEAGRLIFTFHHWRPEAWAELALSLKKAGFLLVNRYVVFSENPVSVHILGLKSLKHDAILVLRPKTGRGKSRNWSKPHKIDTTDSYSFCHDCGTALGWFLATGIDEKSMRKEWQYLLGGNGGGKTSR
jgi:putative DNA methylase